MPPLEGEARRRFLASAQQDFIDYSLIADAEVTIEGDRLVLRLPLAGGSSATESLRSAIGDWQLAMSTCRINADGQWAVTRRRASRGLRHPVSGIRNRHPGVLRTTRPV